jgi:hypothetical protein
MRTYDNACSPARSPEEADVLGLLFPFVLDDLFLGIAPVYL